MKSKTAKMLLFLIQKLIDDNSKLTDDEVIAIGELAKCVKQ